MRKIVFQTATIAFLIGALSFPAWGQTADLQAIAAAQALVDEASDLMDAKNFDKACPKLEQATILVPTGIGARLALAECYEGQGRLASAQGQYLQAEAMAKTAKDAVRAKAAAAEAARLKPKLATIKLVVPNETRQLEGISLTWDDLTWEPGTWGAPIPVDMGKHKLEVKAPGYKTWKYEVSVEANGSVTEQSVPMLEKLPNEPIQSPLKTDPPLKTIPPETSSSRTPLLLTGFGLTLVGIGAGVGFVIAASSKHKESTTTAEKISLNRNVNEILCPAVNNDPACSKLISTESQRDLFANIGIGAFIVGGAAATGSLLFAVASSGKEPKKNALVVLPVPGGVSIAGTF
jgi:hypothetical protein